MLFHVLNGSPGEVRSLALPGHTFLVVAMDGNPLPRPCGFLAYGSVPQSASPPLSR